MTWTLGGDFKVCCQCVAYLFAASKEGYRTLAVDLDQQGNLSAGLGVNLNKLRSTAHRLLINELPRSDATGMCMATYQICRYSWGNRFESLAADRKGQYSIRINDQWRICFEWLDGTPGPSNVEIVDYH